jgi:hypothetical protein
MTEDEFKRMQRQLQNQNFVLVPLDEVKMQEKTNEVSRLKTEMITQMQLDIQRKDELIASANVLIDQLKAEVATLKRAVKSVKVFRATQVWTPELEKAYDLIH